MAASTTPILFAHRGGRAHNPENTIAAFRHALDVGSSALETDVWLTTDGIPVLFHDPALRIRGFKRSISKLPKSSLPSFIPSLSDLYEQCGTDFELSIDLKDSHAATAVIQVAKKFKAENNLWLCHNDFEAVVPWRQLSDSIHLVDSPQYKKNIPEGIESRCHLLRKQGIEVLNLHAKEWSEQEIRLVQQTGLKAFGWNAHDYATAKQLLDFGIDAIYGDDLMAMQQAAADHLA